MKTKTKKFLLSSSLLSMIIFLSGCMRYDDAGDPTGLIYEYLVVPTENLIEWLAGTFNGNYGLAIIIVTIIIRMIIFPLNISQQKKTMTQQIKMSGVKPVLDEIQHEIRTSKDPVEKQELQNELVEVYKENDLSVMGGMSLLPLLIQLPVFTALFQAIRLNNNIQTATFLGISLGERSILIAILAALVYYMQSLVMMSSMPDEQKKQSRMMMMMNPLMILFISVGSPAGLGLYWLVGGIIAVAQSYLINTFYKPKLEAEMEEKYGPQKKVTRKPKRRQVNNPNQKTKSYKASSNSPFDKKNKNVKRKGRNSGKQRRN